MSELPIIKIENITKEYRLGTIGGKTLQGDLQSWWAKIRGKDDPNRKLDAKTYLDNEAFLALNGVSLAVQRGERLGIIGHNGAGKSTLLKLLSRVTAPTSGVIYLNGRVSSMLEVGTGFHGELTGRENIFLNGAILGMSKTEVESKIDEIIDFSECAQFIDTPVKRYSSGMYVKLAFAVAAHLDSEILIMDEVLAVGDLRFQEKCLKKMTEVSKAEGRTILYVSHNMGTIRQLCNRCVVLDTGQLIHDGDVDGAIGIYGNYGAEIMGTNVDLSTRRMEHLPTADKCKMMRIVLCEKETPVYDFQEHMVFELTIKTYKAVFKPCIRIEIRTMDHVPTGAAYIQDLKDFPANETITLSLTLSQVKLVPGKYKALLVIYEKNLLGSYDDLDAVWPAFVFEIIDMKAAMKLKWNNSHWGRTLIGELSINSNCKVT